MNLSYILLAITASCGLLTRNRSLFQLCILATCAAGFYQGIVNLTGIFCLGFFTLLCHLYFKGGYLNKFVKLVLFTGICGLTAGFIFHMIPGFSNSLAVDKMVLSSLSCPLSIYLNFDKTIAALIIYSISGLHTAERFINIKSINQTFLLLALCLATVVPFACLSGYILFDPKIPAILMVWLVNNLLFVCLAEEIIFRGLLQTTLKSLIKSSYWHIVISAVIFGLMHFRGGITYIILASICGIFYGLAYEKTQRIACSTLVHFGLNTTHVMLFAYPAAISVCT